MQPSSTTASVCGAAVGAGVWAAPGAAAVQPASSRHSGRVIQLRIVRSLLLVYGMCGVGRLPPRYHQTRDFATCPPPPFAVQYNQNDTNREGRKR